MNELAQFLMSNVHCTELLAQARFSTQYYIKQTTFMKNIKKTII